MGNKRDGLPVGQAAALFGLLADPSRLRIALLLTHADELCSGALRARMGQTHPVVSNNLTLLRRGRVVDYRREGQHNYYRLTAPLAAELLHLVCGPTEEED